jgi:hypothetical protein
MRNGSYQIMPPLTAAEYAALKADIAAHGVHRWRWKWTKRAMSWTGIIACGRARS